VILLDAYALVALLRGEAAGDEVEKLVCTRDCAATLVNVSECVDVSCRVYGRAFEDVREVFGRLAVSELLLVVAPNEETAFRAGDLRQTHYAKRTCEISLADCYLIAGAGTDDEIATADPAVAAVARAEGIAIVPLPDSSGRRP
jgi:PIN domain nuclease of toxin-antitoxin system